MRLPTRIMLVGGATVLFAPFFVLAQSSTNFDLIGNTVGGGGEESMTSTNFSLDGTIGEVSGGGADSSSFELDSGFEGVTEAPVISLAITGSTSLSLSPSPLTSSQVSTASTTVEASTNADQGYGLEVYATKEFQHTAGTLVPAVTDGSVTAGAQEFGMAVSGTHAAFGDDRGASDGDPLTIAAASSFVPTPVTSTVTFKAGLTNTSPSGDYDGTYTFIATGNF